MNHSSSSGADCLIDASNGRKMYAFFTGVEERIAGRKSRKCTWTAFEVECDWAEVVIEGEHPILIHGSVVNIEENWRTIANFLKEHNLGFSLECYDENENLIHEEKHKPT